MTEARRQLLAELTNLQNHPANWNRDILSFAGFLTDGELPEYVEHKRAELDRAQAR